jgi:hypothetical protein
MVQDESFFILRVMVLFCARAKDYHRPAAIMGGVGHKAIDSLIINISDNEVMIKWESGEFFRQANELTGYSCI